ncbi:MAG: DNA gyrase inhibitor YacG [Nevskiaceae bacterium]|nr:MAG: DNA gyrase inhibitor YacG [Nevskiaceae bacterium]TBR73397.1 MAG: DNA gyrase inhibitor YacG [Nevskiaceae bacterium]
MSEAHGNTPHARIGRCPHCGQRIRLDDTNPWRPFCSERCKLVDLQGWFGGRYQIPGESGSGDSAPGYDDPDQ